MKVDSHIDKDSLLALVQQYFPQLSEPELQRSIAEVAHVVHISAGETLMDYGQYISMLPLVIKGSIKVMREGEDGKELLLYYLNEGETCSMSFSCCMMSKQSQIRAIAEEDSTLISIPLQYVDEWMLVYRSWKNFVMLSYDNRMLEFMNTIDSIAFKKMDERLWEYLLQRASSTQSQVIHTTHSEIANDLNASREAISRLLKQLENMERIRLGRNKIELLSAS